MQFQPSWIVCCNIFINNVSPKGSGKTPCSNVFLKPLEALEKEAMTKHDQDKRRKNLDKKRRTDAGPQTCLMEDSEEEPDDDIVNEKGDGDRSSLFHPMTRCVTSVTPEALIEVLRYSKGNIIIKTDELMVRITYCFVHHRLMVFLCRDLCPSILVRGILKVLYAALYLEKV